MTNLESCGNCYYAKPPKRAPWDLYCSQVRNQCHMAAWNWCASWTKPAKKRNQP